MNKHIVHLFYSLMFLPCPSRAIGLELFKTMRPSMLRASFGRARSLVTFSPAERAIIEQRIVKIDDSIAFEIRYLANLHQNELYPPYFQAMKDTRAILEALRWQRKELQQALGGNKKEK